MNMGVWWWHGLLGLLVDRSNIWNYWILSKINPLIQSDWATMYSGVLRWLWSVCGRGFRTWWSSMLICVCICVSDERNKNICKVERFWRYLAVPLLMQSLVLLLELWVWVVHWASLPKNARVRASKDNLDKITRPIQLKQSQHYQSILNSCRHSQHSAVIKLTKTH